MRHTQRIGRWGERVAADYLVSRGYQIIGHNVRTPYGEIDLIVLLEGQVILVEVKSRTSDSLGPPEVGVGPRKRSHMIACADFYAQEHRIDHWRIDVIAVSRVNGKAQIAHFENAVS